MKNNKSTRINVTNKTHMSNATTGIDNHFKKPVLVNSKKSMTVNGVKYGLSPRIDSPNYSGKKPRFIKGVIV